MVESYSALTESEKFRLARNKRRGELHWYVLYVSSQHERRILEMLTGEPDPYRRHTPKEREKGIWHIDPPIEAYVPVRVERRRWSDRVKEVPVCLAPGMVFVRLCLNDRNRVFVNEHVSHFLYSKELSDPAPIDDETMRIFREAVEQQVDITMVTPVPGDTVMILSGKFCGYVGELIRRDGDSHFQMRLSDNLAFQFRVSTDNIKIVPAGTKAISPDTRYLQSE